MKKYIITFILMALLASCSSTKNKKDKDTLRMEGWSADRIYAEAKDELDGGNYKKAIKYYNILRSNYPYGKYDQQAYLDTAYAYYLYEEKDLALAALDEFAKKYPNHPNNDYVLYLRGQILFNEYKSFLDKLSSQDWSERDIRANQQTFEVFSKLINEYPDSQYARLAEQKLQKILDALGGHEIAVSRYYFNRGAYIAAINRAKNIINEYRNTNYNEEALAIMMTSYEKLGQGQLANDIRDVLSLNYPNSLYLVNNGWYDKKYVAWWKLWSKKEAKPKNQASSSKWKFWKKNKNKPETINTPKETI